MDNLSTDISNKIGALELGGDWESHSDAALESAGAYLNPPPGPTQARTGCGLPPTLIACHIDDGALESTGASMGPPATFPRNTCFQTRIACVGDATLEAAGRVTLGGPTRDLSCLPPPTAICR